MVVEQVTKGAQDKLQGVTGGLVNKIEGWGGWIAAKGQAIVDRIFPPEQRSKFLAKIQAFMLKNPKLSAFLGMNIALTGIPLGLFILFSITVALFAIIVGLILGLLAAVLFIVFAVGTALVVVLPAIFFTTGAATFLFLWGLGGYYILKWANGDEGSKAGGSGQGGGAIGDTLNSITGGRLTSFMDSAKKERSKGDISGYNDTNTQPAEPHSNSTAANKSPPAKKHEPNGVHPEKHAQAAQKQVGNAASKATKATGLDGVHRNVANTTGTVKGGLSGATGLNVPGLS